MNAQGSESDKELVALFEGMDTPGVSDAMDKLGIPGQCRGIAPLDNYRATVVGPAFTVKYVSCGQPAGTVGDFIDDVAEGDVIVIDNDGRTDCTVWGDIMTQYAGIRKIAATRPFSEPGPACAGEAATPGVVARSLIGPIENRYPAQITSRATSPAVSVRCARVL